MAYPPMGLLYLAACLEKIGHSIEIVELGGNIDWRHRTAEIQADLYGIQVVTPNFPICKEIVDLIKANQPDKPVILGGVHPTFLAEECLNNTRCDAVVTGEAETIIGKVVKEADNGELKSRIYSGGLVKVSDIPKPARHLVDLQKYLPGGEKTTTVYTSRGCPFNCAFCSRITGRTYREFPISRVIEEVEEVTQEYGFKHILFGDDDIGLNQKRVMEICNAIKRFDIGFRLNQDVRILSDETLQVAAEAGCTEISFGVESGSNKMLKSMNKGTTAKTNTRAIKMTQSHGIKAKAYFVVNFPGEDEVSVKETLRWAEETRPDKWFLSVFAPLPGSPVFENPEKFGITFLNKKWGDYYLVGKEGSFRPSFKAPGLNFEQQRYLHDLLHDGLVDILD